MATEIYVGTYTDGGATGIYRCAVADDGTFENLGCVAEAANPSYLAFSESGQVLYAASEIERGSVIAYRVRADGGLSRLNEVSSGGNGPCYISVGLGHVFVANYMGGSVAAIPIHDDGSIGPAATVVSHRGNSIHPTRQLQPHVHCAVVRTGTGLVLVADLGTDEILAYRLMRSEGGVGLSLVSRNAVEPGAGPRHVVFHPTEEICFVAHELNSTVVAYSIEAASGRLREIAVRSTLPEPGASDSTVGHLSVSQEGSLVYVSNRGHDSIAVFRWSNKEGSLMPVCYVPSGGATPRHFLLLPAENKLIVANRGSDGVTAFQLDAYGRPQATGHRLTIPSPACIVAATDTT